MASLSLVGDHLAACALLLMLVDKLHQNTLVLEDVTLALHVQLMVQMTINLLGCTVLPQQAAKDTLTAHPHHLHGHTSIRSTIALTVASVTALAARFSIFFFRSFFSSSFFLYSSLSLFTFISPASSLLHIKLLFLRPLQCLHSISLSLKLSFVFNSCSNLCSFLNFTIFL